jgi:hypothetical protein
MAVKKKGVYGEFFSFGGVPNRERCGGEEAAIFSQSLFFRGGNFNLIWTDLIGDWLSGSPTGKRILFLFFPSKDVSQRLCTWIKDCLARAAIPFIKGRRLGPR